MNKYTAKELESFQTIIDKDEIKNILPHRDPILLVDQVVEIKAPDFLIAKKYISPDEPVFKGHFPERPIYPGVYIIEGLAQASALLIKAISKDSGKPLPKYALLGGLEEVRFRKQVVPNDTLYYVVNMTKIRGHFAWVNSQAYVGDDIVAEAKISAVFQ